MTEDDNLMPSEQMALSELDMMRQSSVAEITRQLLDEKKIKMLTDLNQDEIKLITKILFVAETMKIECWAGVLDNFMKLRLSGTRKSREEIIRAAIGVTGKKALGKRIKEVFSGGDSYGA